MAVLISQSFNYRNSVFGCELHILLYARSEISHACNTHTHTHTKKYTKVVNTADFVT